VFVYHSPVTRSPDDNGQPSNSDAAQTESPSGASDESFSSTSAPAYAAAGVDLDHDEAFIDDVKEIAKSTFRPEVLSSIGGFAGMFKAPERYKDPIFVAATDGVGTKLKLAAQIGRYDTIGIDCVAMVVNDLVVQGAEPLIFLDYIAMGDLHKDTASDALRGVAEGCKRAGAALIGGETATMPGVYPEGELEIVGFSVGVVERENVIDGSTISEGDVLIGLASSGFHSNGYSLVRSVLDAGLEAGRFDLFGEPPGMRTNLASALLAPTRIYVKPLLNLIRDFDVHGMVHVTGGGFEGNIPRVLPAGVRARVDTKAWPRPDVYEWITQEGNLAETEMLRVFNCGIGMIVIVPGDCADDVLHRLRGLGERGYRIGTIERKTETEPAIVFDPGFLPPVNPSDDPNA
jgi:phosphoribosylformylglycinamidine cyclo-ligase